VLLNDQGKKLAGTCKGVYFKMNATAFLNLLFSMPLLIKLTIALKWLL
jgi:hypothetical protein